MKILSKSSWAIILFLLALSFHCGCAHQRYMAKEKEKQMGIKNQLAYEQQKKQQLLEEKRTLHNEISILNSEINALHIAVITKEKELDSLLKNKSIPSSRRQKLKEETIEDLRILKIQIKSKEASVNEKKAELEAILLY